MVRMEDQCGGEGQVGWEMKNPHNDTIRVTIMSLELCINGLYHTTKPKRTLSCTRHQLQVSIFHLCFLFTYVIV